MPEILVNNKHWAEKSTNLAWIVVFLRNGGERLRAIWLAKNAMNITIRQAIDWVDSVKIVHKWESREEARKQAKEFPSLHTHDEDLQDFKYYEVSHWPVDEFSEQDNREDER
jgi:hypothetical protein